MLGEISSNSLSNLPQILALEKIPLQDEVPKTQFEPLSIEISLATSTNPVGYADARGYTTPYSDTAAAESSRVQKFEETIERGKEYVKFLYTFRSVSKAIPDVILDEDNPDATETEDIRLKKAEINKKIIEILHPNMSRLKEVAVFVHEASSTLFHFFTYVANLNNVSNSSTRRIASLSSKSEGTAYGDMPPQPSETITILAITTFDILFKLDFIKESKIAFVQDFLRYKRALGMKHLSPELNDELMEIQAFLMNVDPKKQKNHIFQVVRDNIKRLIGHEDLLVWLIDFSLKTIEHEQYVLPDELFRYVRVLPYMMAVMDSIHEDAKDKNLFNNKKLKFSALQRLFKKYPVVPVCQDMTLTLVSALELSFHFNRQTMLSNWMDVYDNKSSYGAEYKLSSHWKDIREEHAKLLVLVTNLTNKLQEEPFTLAPVVDPNTLELSTRVYDLLLACLRALSQWNMMVQNFLAWKYTHPANAGKGSASDAVASGMASDRKNSLSSTMGATAGSTGATSRKTSLSNAMPGGGSRVSVGSATTQEDIGEGYEYSQAIRQNISKEEISILIDVVAMIKSLSSQLLHYDPLFAPIVRYYSHHKIQQLVLGDLLPLFHRVDKRNRSADLIMLLNLRATVADFPASTKAGNDDYRDYSRKQGSVIAKHPPRIATVTPTQLYLLRGFLKYISNENAPLRQKKGIMSSAEMEAIDVKNIELFNEESFYYPYLLAYGQNVKTVSDFSDLWFREYFLEVTRCVQFPIELSLPWIMTEHLITASSTVMPKSSGIADGSSGAAVPGHQTTAASIPMLGNLLYVFDIYNDVAQKSLYEFNQQYLYDEIEAEANLVLDQTIFLLSDEIYNYYKSVAATQTLDKALKHKLEELKTAQHLTVTTRRYDIIAKQRHVRLLGRTINLNFLIGQHITKKFIRDMEIAIKKFESCPIEMGIVDLRNILTILRRLHHLLAVADPRIQGSYDGLFELDSFDTLWTQVDEAVAGTAFRGRVLVHMLRSITMDLFSNYSYNFYTRRFVKSPIIIRGVDYTKPPKSSTLAVLYGGNIYKSFDMGVRLTRGFFGQMHIEALLEVLSMSDSYFEISTVIVECLGYLSVKIKDVSDYVDALYEGILPLKFPDIKSKTLACYQYYYNHLKSLLEYDDLKPEVFQTFREIGNTIAFLRDLSDTLDYWDQFRFVNIAPLLGISPQSKALLTVNVSVTGADGTSVIQEQIKTPLTSVLLSLYDIYADPNKNHAIFTSSSIMNQVPAVSQLLLTSLASVMEYNSVFVFALKQVQDTLIHFELDKKWATDRLDDVTDPSPAVTSTSSGRSNVISPRPINAYSAIDVERHCGFHKTWSTLNFLFCMVDDDITGNNMIELVKGGPLQTVTDEGEFGHGFTFGGCLVIHILGQRHAFELMDYSYQLLTVNVYEKQSAPPAVVQQHSIFSLGGSSAAAAAANAANKVDEKLQQAIDKFITLATDLKTLHGSIFNIFESKLPVPNETLKLKNSELSSHGVVLYHPPAAES